jgi:predicted TPR repeat methyltransferase
VLDLGCGTGLVGVEIQTYARSLAGVDLSPKMIERARERGIYSELICGDLMAALTGADGSEVAITGASRYDVVIAGDVFVYVGKLDGVLPAARRALRSGGVLAFSVESAEDIPAAAGSNDYWLGPTGRYAHHAGYIRSLASGTGFTLTQMRKVRLRLENRQPMMGWLVVLLAAAL